MLSLEQHKRAAGATDQGQDRVGIQRADRAQVDPLGPARMTEGHMFQKHHRVVSGNRGQHQGMGIGRVRGSHHLDPR